jgi:N-acetylglucosamine-6-phosphate deacetylase
MMHWYKGALILPDRVVANGLLRTEAGRITGLWDLEAEKAPQPDPQHLTEAPFVSPGFMDIHVHGGGGGDFMDGDPEAVVAITECHVKHGTTALLATTLTAPEEQILAAIRAVKAAPKRGTRIVGFHIEGPYINEKWRGAQNPEYVRAADLAEVDRWLAVARGATTGAPTDAAHSSTCSCGCNDRWHITLAPEIPGHLDAIRGLVERGFVVSAGHTDCTYAQLQAATQVGLSHATHLYNAMRGLHHREPGTVGGALTLPGLTIELIADGIHVHPASMRLAVNARGVDSSLLVTDAMRAAGMPDGEYVLGELKVTVRNGEARLQDGTLAGSLLTMATAVRNMVKLVGLELHQAVQMASLNPARRHGLDAELGSLAVGKRADLVLLDNDLQVESTIVGGQIAHTRR